METQKLSYYQRNKEKILEKRKFQREERLRLERPFMKFDDESELTFEPKIEPIQVPIDENIMENVVISVIEPLEEVVAEPVVAPVVEKVTKKVIEKK